MKNAVKIDSRARQKQRSRDEDRLEIASGRISMSELNSRNSHVRGFELDWARI